MGANNKQQEKTYQNEFINKYCVAEWCVVEKDKIDVIFQNKQKENLCYVEFKDTLKHEEEIQKALAQIVITNYKQTNRINKLAVVYNYKSKDNNIDVLKYFDISNLDLYSLAIKFENEKSCEPSMDAITKIFHVIENSIITYYNDEIKEFYKKLLEAKDVKIDITLHNIKDVFNEWRQNISFTCEQEESIENDKLVNLFLTDAMDNKNYDKNQTRI